MATARPPSGGTPRARLGIDLSEFQRAPAAARQAGQAINRELQAALTQRRVAARTAAREEAAAMRQAQREQTEAVRQAAREQAAAEKQRTAELKAALQQRRIAVRAAAREETEIQRQAAREQAAIARQSQMVRQGIGQFAGAALGGLGGPVGAVAGGLASGALPIAAGLAVSQGARAAVEASQIATAYERQRVAAVNLAGSQERLNQLMRVYDQATGGVADKAQQLASVTQLMSVGFADNAEELDQFARAIRGISIAMGTSQDTVTQNLILELFSQRGMRLDQLGLQYDKVRQRADELRAADASLTQQQAYQNAVLEQANERFGRLADTTAGQATGVEKLAKTWRDLRLEIGQEIRPDINFAAGELDKFIRKINEAIRAYSRGRQEWEQGIQSQVFLEFVSEGRFAAPPLPGMGPQIAPPPARGVGSGGMSAEDAQKLEDLQVDRLQTQERIEREQGEAIVESAAQFARQRAQVIANYDKQVAREAEDFGRSRANAERKHQQAILDIQRDSARQRVKWEQDLARTIAQAQADAAERVAEFERDHTERLAEFEAERAERVADIRSDSAKRLDEIETRYTREREKAQRDHRDRMLGAVARGDAFALYEERRRFARQAQDAEEAHREQVDKERETLQERLEQEDKAYQKRIDQENKAYQRRLEDEAKALAKSIRQNEEAHARRLEEQAENDRLRIADMQAAFEEQKRQEDIERGIRLARQAQDHQDQLTEMDNQQALRIHQIREHAQGERDELDRQYEIDLANVGIKTEAFARAQEDVVERAIQGHLYFWQELQRRQAEAARAGFPSLANPYEFVPPVPVVPPATGGGGSSAQGGAAASVSMGNVTVTVTGSTNMGQSELYTVVRSAINDVLREAAGS